MNSIVDLLRLNKQRWHDLQMNIDNLRKIKMKIYFIILLGLLVGAGFYLEFNANEIDPISKPRKISTSKSSGTVHSLDTRKMNDLYCAILLIPKSHLPMLQQFAKHKLAKEIKIIPAKIGWHQDEMIVLPKKSILQHKSHPAKSGSVSRPSVNLATVIPASEFSTNIRVAAFLTFLASAKTGSNRFLSGLTHYK